MTTDQEFWEQTAIPMSRMLLQVALTRPEIARVIVDKGKTVSEFAAEMSAETADLLLAQRNRRLEGHPTNVGAEA